MQEIVGKKGISIQQLLPIAILFVVIIIALTFGARITSEVRDEFVETETYSQANETANATDVGGSSVNVTLTYPSIINNSYLIVVNESGGGHGLIIGVGMKTTDYEIVSDSSSSKYECFTPNCNHSVNISYQYTATLESTEYNISQKGLESLYKFGKWLPLLAIVIIAAIIIGVLVMYLGGRRD